MRSISIMSDPTPPLAQEDKRQAIFYFWRCVEGSNPLHKVDDRDNLLNGNLG
jgi:hypothetical protein